jgi:glycosyltransferase involved in cell wall biosynthesis
MNTAPMPDASVIICTYDRCRSLAQVLEDLFAQRVRPELRWEVVVVDNNSSDRTRDVVEEAALNAPVPLHYAFEGRQGKSFALNRGLSLARGRILCFTDDDVRVDPAWVQTLVDHFDGDGVCMGVSGRLLPLLPEDPPRELEPEEIKRYFSYDLGDRITRLARPPYGNNMAYRREAFERYGEFRVDLGPIQGDRDGLGEDSDLGSRLILGGELMCYVPDAVIHHIIAPQELTVTNLDRWHFHYGRSVQRRDPHSPGTPWFLGVPRYLLKRYLAASVRRLIHRGREGRYWRWQTHRVRGQIHEARRLERVLAEERE